MQGNFDLAEEMLGAKYIMDGHIINSCNEQGKTTIECLLDHGLLPPAGHYEGDIHIDHKKYPAIIKVQDKNIHDLKLTAFITTKDTININAPLALRFIKAAGNFQTGSAADCRM